MYYLTVEKLEREQSLSKSQILSSTSGRRSVVLVGCVSFMIAFFFSLLMNLNFPFSPLNYLFGFSTSEEEENPLNLGNEVEKEGVSIVLTPPTTPDPTANANLRGRSQTSNVLSRWDSEFWSLLIYLILTNTLTPRFKKKKPLSLGIDNSPSSPGNLLQIINSTPASPSASPSASPPISSPPSPTNPEPPKPQSSFRKRASSSITPKLRPKFTFSPSSLCNPSELIEDQPIWCKTKTF